MGEKIQVQNFVFLTSELKSTHNFSLENVFCSYFWDTSYFHTFGSQIGVRFRTLSYSLNNVILDIIWKWNMQHVSHSGSAGGGGILHQNISYSPVCPQFQMCWNQHKFDNFSIKMANFCMHFVHFAPFKIFLHPHTFAPPPPRKCNADATTGLSFLYEQV